ncbi:MAG: PEP-utilizing enzyme [Spirochaetaceae bacterium]
MYKKLKDLRKEDYIVYGVKAANLGEMIFHGLPVPNGYVLNIDNLFDSSTQKILQEIFKNLITESNPELAVRSSSLCEDSKELSMAGVFDSIVGIKTFTEMLNAIEQCIQSLFSDKAKSLYLEHNISEDRLKMPIIIQSFKRGRPSGVLFTIDPVKMDSSSIIISGVNSICQDFVNGNMETFRDKIIREDYKNSKHSELIEKSLEIEELFECPQDIEWTKTDDELWMLQARPITNLKIAPPELIYNNEGDEKYTWNLCLEGIKPLNQEIAILSNAAYSKGCEVSGLSFFYEDIMFYGNAKYLRKKKLKNATGLMDAFKENLNRLKDDGQNIFTDIVLPNLLEKKKIVDTYVDKDLTATEIIEFLELGLEYRLEAESYHWQVVFGAADEGVLKEFKDTYSLSTLEAVELISSETLLGEQRRLFQNIADTVIQSPELTNLFNSCKYNNLLLEKIKNSTLAKELLSQIKAQIKKYGLNVLTWDSFQILEERPEKLIEFLRYHVGLAQKGNDQVSTTLDSRKIENRVLDSLNETKKLIYHNEVKYLKKAYLVRDDHAFYIDIGAPGYLRKAIITAGEHLVSKGLLEVYSDIEFYSLLEIKELLIGNIDTSDLNERKSVWKYNYNLPKHIGLKPKVNDFKPSSNDVIASTQISGLSGFVGKVSGKVVKGSEIDKAEGTNLILILGDIRQMDPEPYIGKIAGIIFENGSPLEHVGIWAREKNLPTIFSVIGANKIISGNTVMIDGDKECVEIL